MNETSSAPKSPHLLDEIAAAEYLSISPRTLWGLAAKGKVKCVRIGRRKLYRVPDLERFAASLVGKRS
jgi:hypothetical protein